MQEALSLESDGELFNQQSPRQWTVCPSAIMPVMTACGDSEQSRSRELPCRTPPASQDGAISAAEACGIHAAAKESNHWVSRGAEGAETGGAGSRFLDMHFQKYREQKHLRFPGGGKKPDRHPELGKEQGWREPGDWRFLMFKRILSTSPPPLLRSFTDSGAVCDEAREGANWSGRSGFYTRNRSVQILYE